MTPRFILESSQDVPVAVLGDVMLDKFVWGRVSRISPEAPVPVVEIQREGFRLGGAANVAQNLLSLGARPRLMGTIGDDASGQDLLRALEAQGVSADLILRDPSRPTTVKTRIIAGSQQVVRADHESTLDLEARVAETALEQLSELLRGVKALVLSDYAKGTLTPAIIERAIEGARAEGIPVLVDPKLRRYRCFRQVDLLTPNFGETERMAGLAIESEAELAEAANIILAELDCGAVLITRGERGMSLFERHREPFHIAASAREVFDVTGAGDTVIATAALTMAAGASLAESATLANHAAGIVVGKLGTATVAREELLEAATSSKTAP